MNFNKTVLEIDPSLEIPVIAAFIREMTLKHFKRRGVVVGLSGGIDSAVVAELSVRAFGKDRVLGLLLPEKESNPVSLEYGLKQAEKMGIETIKVDITEYLESLNLYEKRNAVIRSIFHDFDETCRFNITLPQDLLDKDRFAYHSMTVEDKNGHRRKMRIPAVKYLKISACQNMKQRMRMLQLYYYSDKMNYIVAGTTNRTELVQGFFVKFGDGGVDIEPISHLYKTQVYQLAGHLDVIEEILRRPPSPDTQSLPVTDKDFYFCLDFELLDLLLFAYENNEPIEKISKDMNLRPDQVERAIRDIRTKYQSTWHLREMAPGPEPIRERSLASN